MRGWLSFAATAIHSRYVDEDDCPSLANARDFDAYVHVCAQSRVVLFISRRQKDLERLDDASTDLMMASEEKVMLMLGEAFLEVSDNEATEFCEKRVDELQEKVDDLQAEEKEITQEQAKLKSILYGRFGNTINLEDK